MTWRICKSEEHFAARCPQGTGGGKLACPSGFLSATFHVAEGRQAAGHLTWHGLETGAESDGPLARLKHDTQLCSKVLKKENQLNYEFYCPTKYIIWQKADVRTWNIGSGDYDFFAFLDYMNTLFDIPNKNIIDGICQKYSNYIIHIKTFLSKDFYKNIIKIQKSVSPIYKQIERMNIEKQEEWNKYIDEYYLYYYETIRDISDDHIASLNEYFGSIVDKMIGYTNFIKDNKDNKDKKYLEKTSNLYTDSISRLIYNDNSKRVKISKELLEFNSLSLDLYFLTRSFKTTTDDTNPLISIGYFGDNHRIRIEYFLINIMKNYELLDIGFTNEKQRCLEIKKHINFNEMIDKLLE
jgi:hypothetical protein